VKNVSERLRTGREITEGGEGKREIKNNQKGQILIDWGLIMLIGNQIGVLGSVSDYNTRKNVVGENKGGWGGENKRKV